MVIIQDDKVLLLHQSVKDFLVGSRAAHFNESEAHASLAHRCVDELIRNFRSKEKLGITSDDDFWAYSTQYWTEHAHKAQEFKVDHCQAEFFGIDSQCRDHWLERLRSMRYIFPPVPQQFSIFHVAGRWGIPALVDYVYSEGHSNDQLRLFVDLEYCDYEGATPLEQAAKSGHADVISCLLDQGGSEMEITEKVVRAAAGNRNGKEVMALLLDRRRDHITITEDVVKAAAGNYWNGKEVMALLLNQQGD